MNAPAILLAVGAIAGAAALAARAGPAALVINESHSVPRGLYVRTPSGISPGRLVVIAPPPQAIAYLAGLGAPRQARLLKRVAAMGGEAVCARDGRLTWPHGAVQALAYDRRGRPLPVWTGCRRLAADELLVAGDTPTSFDSRYFGPVRQAAVQGVYREVWTW